jgi:hypothetical protein
MPIARDPNYEGPSGIPDEVWQADEIRRIVLKCPYYQAACNDLDGEDMMQEIQAGIHSRDRSPGGSPFDRRRASLGRYVNLVARSVIANLIDAETRRNRRRRAALEEAQRLAAEAEWDARSADVHHRFSDMSHPTTRNPWN